MEDDVGKMRERIADLEALNGELEVALGNLVSRIYAESMIPPGTLARWQRELRPAQEVLKRAGWYDDVAESWEHQDCTDP